MAGESISIFMRLIFLLFLIAPLLSNAQVSGIVLDKNSSIVVTGAWLFSENHQAISDTEGRFTLYTSADDSLKIYCSHPAYEDAVYFVPAHSGKTINLYLSPKADTLAEVSVYAHKEEEKHHSSGQAFSRQNLESLTGPLGEPDLLRSIQSGSGVLQTGELTSGLFVRGGSASQSVIMLQDIPVFNPSHLLGLTNSIDPDALSKATFYKSAFPARAGGWLSGYVLGEARSHVAPDKKGVKISVGTLTSDALLVAPLPKYKTNVVLKGRASYLQMVASVYNHLHESKPGFSPLPDYSYSDWTAQTNTKIGSGELSLLYFESSDRYRGKIRKSHALKADWGNRLFSLKWKQAVGPKGWLEGVLGSSRYRFSMVHENHLLHQVNQSFRGDFFHLDYGSALGNTSILEMGVYLNSFTARADHSQRLLNNDLLMTSGIEQGLPVLGGYVGLEGVKGSWGWNAASRLNLVNRKAYPEPRASVFYHRHEWKLQGFYDHTHQFHHQVNVLGINMPFDFFVLSDRDIPVQSARQLGASLTKSLNPGLQVVWNIYHKWLDGQPDYRKGLNLVFRSEEDAIEAMPGRAYGSEWDITFRRNALMVYAGYSVSETWREMVEADGESVRVHPPFDVRHQLNVQASYQLNPAFSLSAQWFYQSGAPATYPIGIIPLQGLEPSGTVQVVPAYGKEGNIRMPALHRLDLAASYTRNSKRSASTWNAGFYNAYNQANPYFLYYDILRREDGTGQIVTKQRALLPLIPTIRYTWKFQ